MKIQNIESQTFLSQHFISNATKKQMHSLLNRMNEEAIYKKKGSNISFNILRTLSLKQEKACFIDNRLLTTFEKDNFSGSSVVKFAKTTLYIDNETGEIINHKKPLFKTWKSALKDVSNVIKSLYENFNNNKLLNKEYWSGAFDYEKNAKNLIVRSKNNVENSEPLNGVF